MKVGVTVLVNVFVRVNVKVGVNVLVKVFVRVKVWVGLTVLVFVGVLVSVTVDVGVCVFVNVWVIVCVNVGVTVGALALCKEVQTVRMMEIVNYATWDNPFTMFEIMGFGKPDTSQSLLLAAGSTAMAWGPVVSLVAEALGRIAPAGEHATGDVDRAR